MKFIQNVLEDLVALVLALLLLFGLVTYFGTTSLERHVCEMYSNNVDKITCTLHYALDDR